MRRHVAWTEDWGAAPLLAHAGPAPTREGGRGVKGRRQGGSGERKERWRANT